MTGSESPFASPNRRVRMALSDGHMDVCISPDVKPETLDALRRVGEAAIALMKEENDGD